MRKTSVPQVRLIYLIDTQDHSLSSRKQFVQIIACHSLSNILASLLERATLDREIHLHSTFSGINTDTRLCLAFDAYWAFLSKISSWLLLPMVITDVASLLLVTCTASPCVSSMCMGTSRSAKPTKLPLSMSCAVMLRSLESKHEIA
jgi:hypothetical protein